LFLESVFDKAGLLCDLRKVGVYRSSNNQTMLWVLWRTFTTEEAIRAIDLASGLLTLDAAAQLNGTPLRRPDKGFIEAGIEATGAVGMARNRLAGRCDALEVIWEHSAKLRSRCLYWGHPWHPAS
jgi:hypothetical protein